MKHVTQLDRTALWDLMESFGQDVWNYIFFWRETAKTYTVRYILSGSQDAYLTCNLKEEDGYLKIDSSKTLYK